MKDLNDPPAVQLADEMLTLIWPDGVKGAYPFIWLRDNCPSAFHPETQERVQDLLSLPDTPHPRTVACESDCLVVDWAEEAHVSRFPLNWLRANRPGHRAPDAAGHDPVTWDATLGAAGVPRHRASRLLECDEALRDWIGDTVRLGLSIVTGVPEEDGAGARIAQRIGFLRRTNFGTTFEVRTKPEPNNIAYTAEALTLHTDLPNQELPPGYQFLHCLANKATGGSSVFVDGYAVAEALRARDRDAFDLLTTEAIQFRFHDGADDLRARRPVISLDPDGCVAEISFSAHLTEAFDMQPHRMIPFYRAYRAFMALSRDTGFAVTLRLGAGDMAVFDNRRILHGRTAFDAASGLRHLQGCYVDRGEMRSRRRVLGRTEG